MAEQFDVGGVLLERPFKVRRLGHLGLNIDALTHNLGFYRDLLGFRCSDTFDFATELPRQALPPDVAAELPETVGYFMRHGTDHHSFVAFPKCVMDVVAKGPKDVTLNQLTWQVGSLREVAEGRAWLRDTDVRVNRTGRDMPGSNWHVYFADPDGHVNELYYGMEQIGWDGWSKPPEMHVWPFDEEPPLPQQNEQAEVDEILEAGVDPAGGFRYREHRGFDHEVDGVMLARPFKIDRVGPAALFVRDADVSERFYHDVLGFATTEVVTFMGHDVRYLRANDEHHSLVLIPVELREALGLSSHTSTAWIGVHIATYRQLRDALDFLGAEGVERIELPEQLLPGIEFGAWIRDPSGHAFLLYWGMEQVGWSGGPRSPAMRRTLGEPWPDQVQGTFESYQGEPFLGPWG